MLRNIKLLQWMKQYETPDDRGGAVVPTQHDDDVPRTQLDGVSVQDHPPDGGGVQDVQGGSDCGHDLHDEKPDDGGVVIICIQRDDNMLKTQLDGCHLEDHPSDDGRDDEEQLLDAEVVPLLMRTYTVLQKTKFSMLMNNPAMLMSGLIILQMNSRLVLS
jgi:hypothetical protein